MSGMGKAPRSCRWQDTTNTTVVMSARKDELGYFCSIEKDFSALINPFFSPSYL